MERPVLVFKESPAFMPYIGDFIGFANKPCGKNKAGRNFYKLYIVDKDNQLHLEWPGSCYEVDPSKVKALSLLIHSFVNDHCERLKGRFKEEADET